MLSRPVGPSRQQGQLAPSRRAGPVPAATPATAGLTVVLAATALSGVVDGVRWLVFVAVATAVVVTAGVLLRSVTLPGGRPLPVVAVAAGQIAALSCLLTAVFTRSGLLVLLPTPTALQELWLGLRGAMAQVEAGVPPVEATTEMLLLITVGLGLVAVAVDIIAVSARAPAATGLVLLCVFAVPASVSDGMLPWWTFVLGAGGFALLLAVDGQRRHLAWRGESSAPSDSGAGPTATAVAGAALVLALMAGSAITFIGTVGRLPGGGSGASGSGTTGVGLKPFTSLRGQLNRQGVLELFRVHGLDHAAYLRALTLSKYQPGEGWVLGNLSGDGLTGENLPMPPDQNKDGQPAKIQIESLRFRDPWLPVYGVPTALTDMPSGYRYDAQAGTVFSNQARRPGTYTEQALLPDPSPDQLRSAGDPDTVDPAYLRLAGIDPTLYDKVRRLTAGLTDGKPTRFDKVIAINNHFTQGFTYSEQTVQGGSGDALDDFLFTGKTGYCEQFASSMAVMLRTIGIPSRVAIGFTAGYESGTTRLITTQDAHAWVEVFFPGIGWTTFDPTPLANSRRITPPYVLNPQSSSGPGLSVDDDPNSSASPTTGASTTAPNSDRDAGAAAPATGTGGGDWIRPLAVTVLVLVLLAGAITGPALVRRLRRRSHLKAVAEGGPGAATAAWRELLAESWDRGMAVQSTDTVRTAASKIARQHGLDEEGRRGLRTVVGAIERSWYGAANRTEPGSAGLEGLDAALREVLDSFTRNAPLALRSRLLPRSVLRPPRL